MSSLQLTPVRLGAVLFGLLVYGLGIGLAAGGAPCPRCTARTAPA